MRAVVLLLLCAASASAHDAWIEPRATLDSAELRLLLGEHLAAEKVLPFSGTIALARPPFEVTLDAETFNRYLAEEGHDPRFRADRTVRERVKRHLKTFAGAEFDSSFLERFGTRLEIVPLDVPRSGKPFRVKLLLEGKPLAGARVTFHGSTTAVVRTDSRGEAEAALEAGFVLVRATHIRRGDDIDFESDWAALTFRLP
jgi:hypothetical protein